MGNRWKEIWNSKGTGEVMTELDTADEFTVYRTLKKLDGFDVVVEDEVQYYRTFYQSALNMWETVVRDYQIESAFETGCGSGANLYLLKNRGLKADGIDYSAGLVDIAGKVLGESSSVQTGEAITVSVEEKYDLVFSDSVFAYFPDEAYGEAVLKKMYEKANKVVIVSEVFDKELQSVCESRRRELFPDYDKRYESLDKVFYRKEMFQNFAKEHSCTITFENVENKYYWNSEYLFNCYIYKV